MYENIRENKNDLSSSPPPTLSLGVHAALVLIVAVALVGMFQTELARSFQDNSSTPPNDNAPLPINVSGNAQKKRGDLGVGLGSNNLEQNSSLTVGNNQTIKGDGTLKLGESNAKEVLTGPIAGGQIRGSADTDSAGFVVTEDGSGGPIVRQTNLRLYVEDDPNDYFSIWGNSCGTGYSGNCHNLAASQESARFVANGDTYFNISGGRTGIGTTNPDAKLDVLGDGTEGTASIRFSHPGVGDGRGANIGFGTDDKLHIADSWNPESGTIATFDQESGNVGIGTTSPGEKLVVQGGNAAPTNGGTPAKINIIGPIQDKAAGDNPPFEMAELWLGSKEGGSDGKQVSGLASFARNDWNRSPSEGGVGGPINADLRLYTTNSSREPAERMRIEPNGNVGIGTKSPAGLLDIEERTSNSPGKLYLGTADNDVGRGNTINEIRLYARSSPTNDQWAAGIRTVQETNYADDIALAFHTTADRNGGCAVNPGSCYDEQMRIDRAGNVGINTTNPSRILDVNGNARVRDNLFVDDNVYADDYYLRDEGKWVSDLDGGECRTCIQQRDDGSETGGSRCTDWIPNNPDSKVGSWSGWASDSNNYDPDSARVKRECRPS